MVLRLKTIRMSGTRNVDIMVSFPSTGCQNGSELYLTDQMLHFEHFLKKKMVGKFLEKRISEKYRSYKRIQNFSVCNFTVFFSELDTGTFRKTYQFFVSISTSDILIFQCLFYIGHNAKC